MLGIVLIVFQLPISWLAFSIIAPSDQVQPLAAEYFSIRIWGAPAALLNFAVLGWFFGLQKMRAALLVQIAMNGVNIILDLWFVLGLGWGVAGVAWATLISEVGAAGLAVYLAARYARAISGRWSWGSAFNRLAYALDAFANAAEVLVGQAYGERNRSRLRAAFLATGRWAVLFSIVFSLFFLGAGGWIIDLLKLCPESSAIRLTM